MGAKLDARLTNERSDRNNSTHWTAARLLLARLAKLPVGLCLFGTLLSCRRGISRKNMQRLRT